MSTPSEDAQREMEQRALRNVRALVDKYEEKDVVEARSTRRLLFVIVAVVLGIVAISYIAFKLKVPEEAAKVYTLPPPPGPAK